LKKIFYILIVTLAVVPALGQSVNQSKNTPDGKRQMPNANEAYSRDVFMAGAGAVISLNPHKGIGTEIRGIPIFFYRKGKLSIYGPMVNYSLLKNDDWEVRGVAKMRFEGYEDEDSKYLRGMDDREWTMELGGSLSRALGQARVTADITADVLNEHKGHEVTLSYNYDFRAPANIRDLLVTPSFGVTYRSRHLNDYYYGVRSSEAIRGRPRYSVGDSIGLMAALRLNYRFGEKWSVMGMTSVEWLGSEITDSPIVEKHYVASFLLGIMRRF
jgi:outer membrane protein